MNLQKECSSYLSVINYVFIEVGWSFRWSRKRWYLLAVLVFLSS